MASARPAPVDRPPARAGKRGFANRVRSFANRVSALPGFPYLWLISFAVGVLMIVTGGFNTSALPLPRRIAFWVLLLAWNALVWQTWFAFTVRRDADWMRASLIGGVLLILPLPLEIGAVVRIIGVSAAIDPVGTWGSALLISVAIFPVMWIVARQLAKWGEAAAAPPAAPAPGGLLDRARVGAEALAAIEAEDHYCRVRRRDGSHALIHYRFGDALGEVAGLDGTQVHRGAWVAGEAVAGATREGRRWLLILTDGTRLAVSATYLPHVRARGWLNMRGSRCKAP